MVEQAISIDMAAGNMKILLAEIGHNLGTWHANTWFPSAATNADGKCVRSP